MPRKDKCSQLTTSRDQIRMDIIPQARAFPAYWGEERWRRPMLSTDSRPIEAIQTVPGKDTKIYKRKRVTKYIQQTWKATADPTTSWISLPIMANSVKIHNTIATGLLYWEWIWWENAFKRTGVMYEVHLYSYRHIWAKCLPVTTPNRAARVWMNQPRTWRNCDQVSDERNIRERDQRIHTVDHQSIWSESNWVSSGMQKDVEMRSINRVSCGDIINCQCTKTDEQKQSD